MVKIRMLLGTGPRVAFRATPIRGAVIVLLANGDTMAGESRPAGHIGRQDLNSGPRRC